jgi:hypothetical protein
MENRLAKKAIIVEIIGAILVLSPIILNWADLFVDSVDSAKFVVILLAAMLFIGELLLVIGLIMGLVSLKNRQKLLSYISIAIPVVITMMFIIAYDSIMKLF